VVLAIVATLLAGLYPTWRAMRVQPAKALKAAQ
jgi:ABC-type lipoprotein release transport system permease subunit